MTAAFTNSLPRVESLDHVATLERFTNRLFPHLISLRTLVYVRALVFVFMVGTQVHAICDTDRPPVVPAYLPQSKLKRNVKVSLSGFRILLPFTSWAWSLLSTSFGVNALIGYKALVSQEVPNWLLRAGILLFEASAPTALLVAFVVRYGIWPQVLASGKGDKANPTSALKTPRALLWHNANCIFALTEVSLLGGLPVRYVDLSVSALYGLIYILFTWAFMHCWAPPSEGPQFLYFFFDTTLGWTTSIALVVLLIVLISFYGLFCAIHQILDHLGGGPAVHALAVVLISSTVCRVRD